MRESIALWEDDEKIVLSSVQLVGMAELLDWIQAQLLSWLQWLLDQILGWFVAWIQSIIDWIGSTITAIWEWVVGLIANISAYFTEVVNGLWTYVEGLLQQLVGFVQGFLDQIQTYLGNLYAAIMARLRSLLDQVLSWLSSIVQKVVHLIETGLESIVSAARVLKDAVLNWIDQIAVRAVAVYDAAVLYIRTGIEQLIGGADSLLEAIQERLVGLKEAFGEAATQVVERIKDSGTELSESLQETMSEAFAKIVEWATPEELDAMLGQMERLTAGEASIAELRDFVSRGWRAIVPKNPVWQGFFTVLAVTAGAIPLLLQLSGASASLMMQEFALQFPYALLGPGDVSAAYRRGLVTEERAIDTIRRQGFSTEDANAVIKLAEGPPSEPDLFAMWHRGLLSELDLDHALHQRGFSPEFRARMKKATFIIPPVADLILMAVREAFSPEIAQRFGQYEDFPEPLAEWAGKQGLTRDWAERYWASHWGLPSPNQGFEMLHRGVIGQEDLNLLLRALDVMPWWRDKLTAIAYAPFTRVDIRRMHKVEILDEAGVKRAYQDIGYDDEKAQALTEFTKRLNAPTNIDDDEELGRLSRSHILGFYSDGVLDRARTIQLLIGIGNTADAANLYVDNVDFKQEREDRSEAASFVVDQALAGLISESTAANELRRLGLETVEVDRIMVRLYRARERRVKVPSRTEALRMARKGYLSKSEYESFLDTLGYARVWVKRYMLELEGFLSADQAKV